MRDPWSARLSVGVGAALLVGAAALGSWPGSPVGVGSVALQLLDIGAVLWAGAFVVGRRPENRVGVVLLLGGLAAALLLFLTYYADAALLAGADIPGGIWALVGSQLLWPAVYFGLFVLLPLLLPDGTFLSPRWRRLAIALGALTLVAMVIAPLEPELVVGTMTVANPIGVVDPALVSPLDLTWTILFAAGLVAAAGSLVVRYRRSDAERRDQLRWVTAAIGLTLIVVVAQLVTDQFVPTLALPDVSFLAPLAAVPASIALSIARHRLFDIDLAIRRSLVFGALWLGIALAYAGIAAALGLAAGRLSVQAAVLATIAATVLFQPARARLVRLADRLAYGRRAGAYEVLRDFGAATEGTIDVNDIGPRLA